MTPLAAASVRYRPGEAGVVAGLAGGDGAATGRRRPRGRASLLRGAERVTIVLGRPSLAEGESTIVDAVAALLDAFPDAGVLTVLRRANVHGALDMGLAPGLLPGHVTLDDGRRRGSPSAWRHGAGGRGLDAAGDPHGRGRRRASTPSCCSAPTRSPTSPTATSPAGPSSGADTSSPSTPTAPRRSSGPRSCCRPPGPARSPGTTTNIEGRVLTARPEGHAAGHGPRRLAASPPSSPSASAPTSASSRSTASGTRSSGWRRATPASPPSVLAWAPPARRRAHAARPRAPARARRHPGHHRQPAPRHRRRRGRRRRRRGRRRDRRGAPGGRRPRPRPSRPSASATTTPPTAPPTPGPPARPARRCSTFAPPGAADRAAARRRLRPPPRRHPHALRPGHARRRTRRRCAGLAGAGRGAPEPGRPRPPRPGRRGHGRGVASPRAQAHPRGRRRRRRARRAAPPCSSTTTAPTRPTSSTSPPPVTTIQVETPS